MRSAKKILNPAASVVDHPLELGNIPGFLYGKPLELQWNCQKWPKPWGPKRKFRVFIPEVDGRSKCAAMDGGCDAVVLCQATISSWWFPWFSGMEKDGNRHQSHHVANSKRGIFGSRSKSRNNCSNSLGIAWHEWVKNDGYSDAFEAFHILQRMISWTIA